ncbi:MAG: hypothetical protein WC728_02175 [Elusimicrobiota bacterium]
MTRNSGPRERAEEYLKTAHLYKLGTLPTEACHPRTRNLSELARSDLKEAARLLLSVDVDALRAVRGALPEVSELTAAVQDTFKAGGRVFLCGCGATGRLSLSLEYLWRRAAREGSRDSVVGFMAGGDVALVHSLEGFEDFPEYGAEQLRGLGFGKNDLLVSSTEGGETPFVIGATEEACRVSKRPPFFLFCNPKDVLLREVERSRRVLQNPGIRSICLYVGPMALSGSTRMQASTVLMLGIGLALFPGKDARLEEFIAHTLSLDISRLEPFIRLEADAYHANDRVLYTADEYAITVFTDSTERSPTFSLPPFNNQVLPRNEHSLSYIMLPGCRTPIEAWRKLLLREPRVLGWPARNPKTTLEYLLGFDFGDNARAYRERVLPGAHHLEFSITREGKDVLWSFRKHSERFRNSGHGELFDHLLLKMMLNIHSTLLMGRMNRYMGNLMTWVNPTNGKLVDRAARYARLLLEGSGVTGVTHEEVVRELFVQMESLSDNESVVLKTLAALKAR